MTSPIKKTEIGSVRDPRDLVPEYEDKLSQLEALRDEYSALEAKIEVGCTVAGTFGQGNIFSQKGSLRLDDMQANLLRSAWWAAYKWCNMETLATAADKSRIETDFQKPAPFTVPNLLATFGPYLADQRGVILRGLAEAFITLDDAYKSHSKVKVGVKGLPKRVIIRNAASEWGRAWGWEKLRDMLHALKVFDGEGLVPNDIIQEIRSKKLLNYRGLEFRWFENGNVHVYFSEHACLQINRGLAEYYGEVLPDVEPDKSKSKPFKRGETSVSKDLQYFPTPKAAVSKMLSNASLYRVERVLEPSCGCGRIMDAVREMAKRDMYDVRIDGFEYDWGRVKEARAKGHSVVHANFLEVIPNPIYDLVVMNPPFYGQHYLKHIEHARKFLKSGGELISILPATAHYDHKKLPPHHWRDLPVGSFAESGTRVPTGYATMGAA